MIAMTYNGDYMLTDASDNLWWWLMAVADDDR